jgi:hypothetical protein
MDLPVSVYDAITAMLPIQEAFTLAQCCKEAYDHVSKNTQLIINNDTTTPLLLLTKNLNKSESHITSNHVLLTKASLKAKDPCIYENLLKLPEFLDDICLQDYVVSRVIFDPQNTPEEVHSQIISFFTTCLVTFDTEPYTVQEKYKIFVFITKVFVKFIFWVISNGHQDNEELCLFQSKSFAAAYLKKIDYFMCTDNTIKINDAQQRTDTIQYLSSVKKYIIAFKRKAFSHKSMKLYIGPKGGIFTIYRNRKHYIK